MTAAVINLDCRLGMMSMPEGSVDAIVCDPPYGLSRQPNMREVLTHWLNGDEYHPTCGGFMGKQWDSFVPGPLVWEQALRVLKPGGYLVAFAGSRTVDLMATSLRLGGFEVVDMLHWLYGSGMPKSMAIDKAIDRQRHDRDEVLEVTKWIADARDAAKLSNKAIDDAFGFAGMAGHWTSQKSQPSIPTLEQVPKLLEILGWPTVPPRVGELLIVLNGNKGEPGADWHNREVVGQHDKTSGAANWRIKYDESREHERPELGKITTAHSDAAKQWEGWGTALKPCHEPIVLCRKPLDGTYAHNVQEHGVGGLNIEGCKGPRWPGNVMHDGCLPEPMDRYFYSAKATKADREAGLENFEHVSAGEITGGRKEGSAGLQNGRAGAGRTGGGKNIHPTVKPTELMRWLCRLVTPPGGMILDPFTGSGSTGRGAVLEGFQFMGFELSADYAEIARARILDAEKQAGDTDAN